MSQLASIYQAVQFAEGHLTEPIAVADMAEAASCSLYHFCRTFNKVVHHTPYDYLMRRRLSEAARLLLTTDRKIIDVALDYQFNSPESFSRAFRRMFGQQPTQWRKQTRLDRRCFLSAATLEYLQHLNQGDYLKPAVMEKDQFHLAGLMTLVKPGSPGVTDLWTLLFQTLAGLPPLSGPQNYFGLSWFGPEDQAPFFYLAALEVTEPAWFEGTPLVAKSIPRQKYARFVHKGLRQKLPLTRDYIYQTWLPKSGRRLTSSLEIETYGPEGGKDNTQMSEIPVLIPIDG